MFYLMFTNFIYFQTMWSTDISFRKKFKMLKIITLVQFVLIHSVFCDEHDHLYKVINDKNKGKQSIST